MLHMQSDCLVTQLIHEVRLPIPLKPGWVEAVKHALKHRMRDRTDEIDRRLQMASDRFEGLFRLFQSLLCNTKRFHTFLKVEFYPETADRAERSRRRKTH